MNIIITLINSVKLTDFGAAAPLTTGNREDERAAALARRAQQGDYDDGWAPPLMTGGLTDYLRSNQRATEPDGLLSRT